jgi:hypothetical protein
MSTFSEIVNIIQKISPTGINEWNVIDKIQKNPKTNIQDILIHSLIEHIQNQKEELQKLNGEEVHMKVSIQIPTQVKKEEEPIQVKKEEEPIEVKKEEEPIQALCIKNEKTLWRNARKIDVNSLFQKKETPIEKVEEEKIEIQGNTNLIQQIMDMGNFENYREYQRKYVSKIIKELVKMCDMALQDKKLNEFREIGQIGRESISLTQIVETLFMENHKIVRFWEIYNDEKDYRLSKLGMDLFVFILENHDFIHYLSLLTPELLDTYEYLS